MRKHTNRNQRGQSVVFYLFLVTFSLAKYSKSILCVNLYAGTVENDYMQSLAETVSPLLDVSYHCCCPDCCCTLPTVSPDSKAILAQNPEGEEEAVWSKHGFYCSHPTFHTSKIRKSL